MADEEFMNAHRPAQVPVRPGTDAYPVRARLIRLDGEETWTAATAWVAELTGMLDLTTWPPGMRVLIRAERPHPGAQLRFTDIDGNRLTAFVTNTTQRQLADLELRHRRRAGEVVPSQFCPSVRAAHPPLPAVWVAADHQTVDGVALDLG